MHTFVCKKIGDTTFADIYDSLVAIIGQPPGAGSVGNRVPPDTARSSAPRSPAARSTASRVSGSTSPA